MKTPHDNEDVTHLNPREKPKVAMLIEMMESAVLANTDLITRMENARYIRDCVIPGRQRDGLKGRDEKGRTDDEWKSDVQVKLADLIITEQTLMLMLMVLRSNVTATPQEMEDTGGGTLAVSLLQYYFTGQMSVEVWETLGRAFDIALGYGHAIVRVGWKESHRMVTKSLTYETLLDWARLKGQQEAAEELTALAGDRQLSEGQVQELTGVIEAAGEEAAAETMATLAVRQERPRLVALLQAFDETICQGEPARLAAALQRGTAGEFLYYAKERTESRPQWRALQPFVDVFYAGLCEDLQDEPFIAEVEWVTKQQLLERAAAEGWDDDWTQAVALMPGRCFSIALTAGQDWILNGADVGQVIPWHEREKNYYMLVTLTYKAVSTYGVTGVWETMVHDAAPESYAYHKLVDDADGKYNYIKIPRGLKRRLVDNTGVPEDVESEQAQLKRMIDARQNKTALEVDPPVKIHWKDAKRNLRLDIRPGGQYPEREGTNTSFLQVGSPGAQQQSITDETLLWQQIYRRFGLIDESVPAALTQAHMEVQGGHFFKYIKELIGKTFALLQQHMDPLTGIRVAGGPEVFAAAAGAEGNKVLNVTRDDIRGRYDFTIEFDPRNLNMEWVLERLKAVTEFILPFDRTAAVDIAPILRMAMSWVDPRLAAHVKTGDKAADDEEMDELSAWAIIAAGEEPAMREGVDYATRYGVWQRMLGRSQRAVGIIKSDPVVLALAQSRLKYLKQGMEQEKNKIIGRTGTAGTFDQEASLLGE